MKKNSNILLFYVSRETLKSKKNNVPRETLFMIANYKEILYIIYAQHLYSNQVREGIQQP